MVNVDKLNKTIESLDIKSKEIDGLIEMQKKFKVIADEIETLNNKFKYEDNNLLDMRKEANKVFDKSKEVVDDVAKVVNKKFSGFDVVLEKNNNNILNLETELKQIINEFNGTAKKITTILEEIDVLDNDVMKQLNNIKTENYKMINELHGALDAKLGLLKSDIMLELRNLEERLNNKVNAKSLDIMNKFEENEKSLTIKNDEIKSSLKNQDDVINKVNDEISKKLVDLEKKNMIFMIVIIVLIVLNIGVVFFK